MIGRDLSGVRVLMFLSPASAGSKFFGNRDPRASARGYLLPPLRGWLSITSFHLIISIRVTG